MTCRGPDAWRAAARQALAAPAASAAGPGRAPSPHPVPLSAPGETSAAPLPSVVSEGRLAQPRRPQALTCTWTAHARGRRARSLARLPSSPPPHARETPARPRPRDDPVEEEGRRAGGGVAAAWTPPWGGASPCLRRLPGSWAPRRVRAGACTAEGAPTAQPSPRAPAVPAVALGSWHSSLVRCGCGRHRCSAPCLGRPSEVGIGRTREGTLCGAAISQASLLCPRHPEGPVVLADKGAASLCGGRRTCSHGDPSLFRRRACPGQQRPTSLAPSAHAPSAPPPAGTCQPEACAVRAMPGAGRLGLPGPPPAEGPAVAGSALCSSGLGGSRRLSASPR